MSNRWTARPVPQPTSRICTPGARCICRGRAGLARHHPWGLLAGEGHIPLACTPEPSTAAPVSGLVEESEVKFEHTMKIERVWEAPRVSKPYTEEQWTQVGE